MLRRLVHPVLTTIVAVSMVACSSDPADERSPDRSTSSLGTVSVTIDPQQETEATLGDFTVRLPAGSTSGPGEIALAPAGAAPALEVPGLTMSDGVSVTLSGTDLVAEATVVVDTEHEPGTDDVPMVLWERPEGGVELLAATVTETDDRVIVEARTTHFSQGWFGLLDPRALADQALSELQGVLTGRSNVEQPQCQGESDLREMIEVVSDEGDAVKWCAGTAEGRAFVTIANNRRTFTQVAVPRAWTTNDSTWGLSVDQLVRALGTGVETFAAAYPKDRYIVLIKAGETMTFTAPAGTATEVEIRARASMAGYLLQILSQAFDMQAGMARSFNVVNPWTGNWFEVIQGATPNVPRELTEAWATCFRSFTDNLTDEPWNTPEAERIPRLTLFAIDCFAAITKAGIAAAPQLSALGAQTVSTVAGIVGTVMGLVNSLSASVRGLYDEVRSLGASGSTLYSIRLVPKLAAASLRNATIPAGSCNTGEVGWSVKEPVPLRDGQGWVGDVDAGDVTSIMDIRVLGRADVNGDGAVEVVVMLHCSGSPPELCCAGQGSLRWMVAVFQEDQGRLVRLATPYAGGSTYPGDEYGPLERGIEEASLEGTTLVTREFIYYAHNYTSEEAGGDPLRSFDVRLVLMNGRWVTP